MPVPAERQRVLSAAPIDPHGRYVLYWMMGARRLRSNPALEHAVALANELRKPLLVHEPVRCGHRWANDRAHAFMLHGAADNAAACAAHHLYVEPAPGAGDGLIEALSADAAAVVCDDTPLFIGRFMAVSGPRLPVHTVAVDGVGLLPLSAAPQPFARAVDFRRFLQRTLPAHLRWWPQEEPLRALAVRTPPVIDAAIFRRWPTADPARVDLAALPIDHAVPPVAEAVGGARHAAALLDRFLRTRLPRYDRERMDLDDEVGSGLSPWLHFGHISAHEIAAAALGADWSLDRIGSPRSGAKDGWWGAPPAVEAFLDELVTWRELGHVFARFHADDCAWETIPAWARTTLEAHAGDPRPHVYDLDAFQRAATHDPLWNAAQTQLVREGRIHNYLRMLWGKKILEWTPHPRVALDVMVELNNRWSLDGCDPNSASGICWVLGRYDRPWAPVRPIFGSIRYMTSASTARKTSVVAYLKRYAPV